MREILFRGKRICEKKNWVEGCLLNMDEDSGHVFIVPFFCNASTIPISRLVEYTSAYVNPKTVGQFTGLFDKNGKKIFEGDILKFHKFKGEPDWLGFVRYDISMFVIEGEQPVDNGGFEVQLCSIDRKRCEIIGNIHDNPELLEG